MLSSDRLSSGLGSVLDSTWLRTPLETRLGPDRVLAWLDARFAAQLRHRVGSDQTRGSGLGSAFFETRDTARPFRDSNWHLVSEIGSVFDLGLQSAWWASLGARKSAELCPTTSLTRSAVQLGDIELVGLGASLEARGWLSARAGFEAQPDQLGSA